MGRALVVTAILAFALPGSARPRGFPQPTVRRSIARSTPSSTARSSDRTRELRGTWSRRASATGWAVPPGRKGTFPS